MRPATWIRQHPRDPGTSRDRQPILDPATVINMSENTLLGDYLRARRELVAPASVGIPVTGVRRVAGLRREEVAMLAGISSDYYLRLEQGRDRNPSVQVLEALARVLHLDADATAYLIELAQARGNNRSARPVARARTSPPERVPVSIRQLIDGW